MSSRETRAAIRAHSKARKRWPGVTRRLDDCNGRYYFDAAAADLASDFFPECLHHHKGEFAGRPFVLAEWQRELVIRPLFGWKRKADHLRRFRKIYLGVAKKNGKTPLGAGCGLFLALCDDEDGAEVYCAAADREQAAILFDSARAMVEDDTDLKAMCNVYRRSIVHPGTRSSFKVLSSEAKTKHGPNIHGLIFDEFHAQAARELHDTLARGTAARRQPVTMYITTAGDDMESICREEQDYAEGVISERIKDESYLPVIFAAAPEEDWAKVKTWRKANPSLGETVKLDYLKAECEAAKAEPRKQASFRQLHLNQWGQQAEIWIPVEDWDTCKAEPDEDGWVACAAGGDLSSKLDLTSFVVVLAYRDSSGAVEIEVAEKDEQGREIRDDEGKARRRKLAIDFRVEVFPFFWIPEETLHERVKIERVPYDLWHASKSVRVTSGAIVDYDQVYDDIVEEIGPRFGLKDGQIGYDPHNATQLMGQIQTAGYKVVEVPQTVLHLSDAAKTLEALVRAQRLSHDGNPCMRWNVENVAVKEDKKGNIYPFKRPPMRRRRIDGITGTVIALSRLLAEPVGKKRSVYEDRGLVVFY